MRLVRAASLSVRATAARATQSPAPRALDVSLQPVWPQTKKFSPSCAAEPQLHALPAAEAIPPAWHPPRSCCQTAVCRRCCCTVNELAPARRLEPVGQQAAASCLPPAGRLCKELLAAASPARTQPTYPQRPEPSSATWLSQSATCRPEQRPLLCQGACPGDAHEIPYHHAQHSPRCHLPKNRVERLTPCAKPMKA